MQSRYPRGQIDASHIFALNISHITFTCHDIDTCNLTRSGGDDQNRPAYFHGSFSYASSGQRPDCKADFLQDEEGSFFSHLPLDTKDSTPATTRSRHRSSHISDLLRLMKVSFSRLPGAAHDAFVSCSSPFQRPGYNAVRCHPFNNSSPDKAFRTLPRYPCIFER